MRVEMKGLEELQRKLKEMDNFQPIEKKALEESGDYFKEKLESNVYSFGLKERSGKSAESFVLSREIIQGTIKVGLSNQNNDAFYLYFHEHGTSKMRARPFMRPTFEQEKKNIEKVMAEEIRKGLRL